MSVAIRPERLRLGLPGGEAENQAAGVVATATYRGGTADYRVRLAAGAELLLYEVEKAHRKS